MKVTRLRVLSEAWPGKSRYGSDIGAPPVGDSDIYCKY